MRICFFAFRRCPSPIWVVRMKCSECMKAKVHHNIEHIYIYIVFFMFVLNVHAFAFTQIASNRCTTITSYIEQASSVNSLPHDRHKKHPIRTQFFICFRFYFAYVSRADHLGFFFMVNAKRNNRKISRISTSESEFSIRFRLRLKSAWR